MKNITYITRIIRIQETQAVSEATILPEGPITNMSAPKGICESDAICILTPNLESTRRHVLRELYYMLGVDGIFDELAAGVHTDAPAHVIVLNAVEAIPGNFLANTMELEPCCMEAPAYISELTSSLAKETFDCLDLEDKVRRRKGNTDTVKRRRLHISETARIFRELAAKWGM